MTQLPEPLQAVVDNFSRLPGMGPKSALRAALALLKFPRAQADTLAQSVLALRERLFFCDRCACLSDCDPCCICADPERRNDELMIVAEWDSLIALESGGFYRGKYLVLGGLLAPLENITSQNLEIDRLVARLEENTIREVILALGTTLDAETTASFLKDMIRKRSPQVHISRLAQGIPLGAEVKYVDRETLRQSLDFRQNV